MHTRTCPMRPAYLVAVVAILLFGLAATGGWCAEPPSQTGLPTELVIPDEPPLDEQLKTMQALYQAGQQFLPETGIVASVKSMFTGGEQAQYATVPMLAEKAASLRGDLVKAEGIYHAGEERGTLRSMGAELAIEMMGGTTPTGFGAVGDDPDGMPVMVTGRIETDDDAALLRAESFVPSAAITGLRIARIYARLEKYEDAFDAYEKIATHGALVNRPLAAFARVRAGQLALEELNDEKRARAQYSAAWQPYSVEENGEPIYFTWIPQPDDGWEKVPAAEAIAPRLDELSSELVGYRIVDFFTRIAGGNPAFGVILMAVVVRLGIYPLTKKQLESQRRMQAIQPQIKELQQKHATDKQKFQEEFWELCQENNCNPLGGCLPMLVQMPILIFLYRGIRDYIVQFHGADFLWISNLAQPNMMLLILYTISMVAFQKMAAQNQPTADPQQKQQQQMMAYMMPLMFFFFFQSFPAAFILYWLGSNLIYFSEHLVYARAHGEEDTEESTDIDRGDGQSGGFIASMIDAAKRMQQSDDGEDERPPSYEEQRKQEKGQKRRKSR